MARSADAVDNTASAVLREYYSNSDYIITAEGIMKLTAVLGCLLSGVLFLVGGGCAGAAGLPAGGATVAFVTAALLALQLTATLLGAPNYAPHAALYADVVGSAVMGAMLLLVGTLRLTLCERSGRFVYVYTPLSAINAVLVVGAAVVMYATVTRRWDAARGPAWEPRREPPQDVDV